jgi:hypothetical protein
MSTTGIALTILILTPVVIGWIVIEGIVNVKGKSE